ncbi:MAG: hypothetical protein ACYC36_13270 [Bellilinea sp.]
MTNDELRLAVAKARGEIRPETKLPKEIGYFWYGTPNYPENIAAAMTLMQEAADKNIYCSLVYSRHHRMWTARFETTLTQRHAKDAARAVSESYLAWKAAQ